MVELARVELNIFVVCPVRQDDPSIEIRVSSAARKNAEVPIWQASAGELTFLLLSL